MLAEDPLYDNFIKPIERSPIQIDPVRSRLKGCMHEVTPAKAIQLTLTKIMTKKIVHKMHEYIKYINA